MATKKRKTPVRRKAKARVPTLARLLKDLRTFFQHQNEDDRGKLWDILTGLRGPDDGNDDTKVATTAVIRYAFLGGDFPQPNGAIVEPDAEQSLKDRLPMDDWSHFRNHAMRAFMALGLKWNKVNK